VGQQLLDVLPQVAGQMDEIRAALNAERVQTIQTVVWEDAEGNPRTYEMTIYPLEGIRPAEAVLRIDDVTDRIRLQETPSIYTDYFGPTSGTEV
jgi:hypothetical protein